MNMPLKFQCFVSSNPHKITQLYGMTSTPLDLALYQNNNIPIIEALLSTKKINPNTPIGYNERPLQYAIKN